MCSESFFLTMPKKRRKDVARYLHELILVSLLPRQHSSECFCLRSCDSGCAGELDCREVVGEETV